MLALVISHFTKNGLGANSSKSTLDDIACEPFNYQEVILKLTGEPYYYQEMSQSLGNVHLKLFAIREMIFGESEFQ